MSIYDSFQQQNDTRFIINPDIKMKSSTLTCKNFFTSQETKTKVKGRTLFPFKCIRFKDKRVSFHLVEKNIVGDQIKQD